MTQSTTLNRAVALSMTAALVLSLLAIAMPASAAMNSSSIKIEVENSGTITNTTSAKASTGGNLAGGSTGGSGGSGGDIEVDDGDNNNGGALAGEGGNGGNAGIGGTVFTGDADAEAGTLNSLNATDVDVDLWGEDMNSSEIKVKVENEDHHDGNTISNVTRAKARTGDNNAAGSTGGNGGTGGEVEVDDGDNNNGGAEAGDGGNGGAGADGGWVETGIATSLSGSVNVLNTTLVRVRL